MTHLRVLKESAATVDLLDVYEPPYGLAYFVKWVQESTPVEAEAMLRRAFAAAQTKAIVGDMRRRNAAAELFVAAKEALEQYRKTGAVAHAMARLTAAVDKGEA